MCRFCVIETMGEVKDVNLEQRIIVKFFVKQGKSIKKDLRAAVNCLWYTDKMAVARVKNRAKHFARGGNWFVTMKEKEDQ